MSAVNSIDFLIAPFGANVIAPAGKIRQWQELIKKRAKNPNALFFIVNQDAFSLSKFKPYERERIKNFFKFALKEMPGRIFILKDKQIRNIPTNFFTKNRISFDKVVEVKQYGKHAGICVEDNMYYISGRLKQLFPKTAFRQRTLITPSFHSSSVTTKRIINLIKKKRPDLSGTAGRDVLVKMLVDGNLTYQMALNQINKVKDLRELGPRRRRK